MRANRAMDAKWGTFLTFKNTDPNDILEDRHDNAADPGHFTTVTPARFECALPNFWCQNAILDTGSSISLVRRSIADQVDPERKFRFNGPPVTLNGIGTSHTDGVLLTQIKVGGKVFRAALHIVDNCPDVLLGVDVLRPLGCTVDCSNGRATFGNNGVSFAVDFQNKPKGSASWTIRSCTARLVPAGCQMQIPVHNPVRDSPGTFLFHGWATLGQGPDSFMTPANGVFSRASSHVLVANHGAHAVNVYDGMPLGDIEYLNLKDDVSGAAWSIQLDGPTPGWSQTSSLCVKDLNDGPRIKEAELCYAASVNFGHDSTQIQHPTDNDDALWETFDRDEKDQARQAVAFPKDANRVVQGFNFGANAPQSLIDAVQRHPTAFTFDGTPGTVKASKVSMRIDADTSKVKSSALRPLSPAKRDELKKTIDQLQGWDVIERSNASIAHPVVMVQQSGKWRMCVDYRALNAVTRPDPYPMQRAEDIFNSLGGKRLFSSLDAAKGYHQVNLREDDREKTAFVTPFGLFQFKRVPFGLRNAPAVFQRYMDSLLGGLRYQNALVYIDDILVYSDSEEEHVRAVEEILTRAADDGLKFAPSKCFFGFDCLKVLGRMVSPEGLAAPGDRVAAVRDMPYPDTLGKLWTFLGMTGYYRQFICKYATIAGPLYDLLKGFKHRRLDNGNYQLVSPDGADVSKAKAKIVLEPKHTKAIQTLKDALTRPPALAFADPSKEYILYCDASRDGFGAVLTQILPLPEKSVDGPITQDAFPATANEVGDSSGVDKPIQIGDMDTIRNAQANDSTCQEARVKGLCGHLGVTAHDDILYVSEGNVQRLLLPEGLVNDAIHDHHDIRGHQGVGRTLASMSVSLYHPCLRQRVTQYVASCTVCQRNKPSHQKPEGTTINTRDISPIAFHTISLDIIPSLPAAQGNIDAILTVVCLFSKAIILIPCSSSASAKKVARLFLTNVCRRGFLPQRIISDLGSAFISSMWRELHTELGTRLSYSCAYHQQANPIERYNQTIEMAIRCLCTEREGRGWLHTLPYVEMGLNSVPSSVTGRAPFDLLYTSYSSVSPRLFSTMPSQSEALKEARETIKLAHDRLRAAQEVQAVHFDKRHRPPREWTVGDWAMIDTHIRPVNRPTTKFTSRFVGPFRVIRVLSKVAVELSLPPAMRLDPIFVVSQLKFVPPPEGEDQRHHENDPADHQPGIRPGATADGPALTNDNTEADDVRRSARLQGRPRKTWNRADVRLTWQGEDDQKQANVASFSAMPKPGPGEAERVVLYYSRQLLPAEKNYHITELELRGLVVAVLRCQEWVQGCKHLWVVTDHSPLVSILGRSKNVTYNSRVERFRMDLLPYLSYMTVVHKPGKAHSNVDTLSRIPLPFFTSPAEDDKVDDSLRPK